jgi:Tol biopolymer transport system component
VGFWGVGPEGGAAELYTDRLGVYSRDMNYLAYPQNGQAVVERVSDGQAWSIPSGGRVVSFSADSSRVAWTAGQSGPPFDTAAGEVWVSLVDGSQPQLVTSVYGGGFSGWFPDGSLLVSGAMDLSDQDVVLWKVPLGGGESVELARAGRLRSPAISPGGSWVAYQVVFTGDPAEEGLWLVNTETGERRKLGLFGAYRWRDDGRLLVVPLDLTQEAHQLWEIQAGTGEAYPLTDGKITPFKIANGDWSVSPDGNRIAFVSASDGNIWLLELPRL